MSNHAEICEMLKVTRNCLTECLSLTAVKELSLRSNSSVIVSTSRPSQTAWPGLAGLNLLWIILQAGARPALPWQAVKVCPQLPSLERARAALELPGHKTENLI